MIKYQSAHKKSMKLYRNLYIELLCTTKAAAKLGSNSVKFPLVLIQNAPKNLVIHSAYNIQARLLSNPLLHHVCHL